jgi:hypothetical protein
MGAWSRLFGKPVKINDSFFGELLFMEVKANPANSYFEGWRHFEPTDEQIEVGVSGSLQSPTQVQKDFFRQVEANYALVTQRIIPLIEHTFHEWQADFKINNFAKAFKPVYLFIPSCVQNPIKWEIAFESEPGLVNYNYPYILTVEMTAYEPQHISVSQ